MQSNEIMVKGEEYLSNFCTNNEHVDFFSTRPYLINKSKKGTIYKERGHWGSKGNLAIAEAIKQYLIEAELY